MRKTIILTMGMFMLLIMFSPLTLQEEESTTLVDGQEMLINGQQISQENQQAIARRVDATWKELRSLNTITSTTLEKIIKEQIAQHKAEKKILKEIIMNQKRILQHQAQLKTTNRSMAILLKELVKQMEAK